LSCVAGAEELDDDEPPLSWLDDELSSLWGPDDSLDEAGSSPPPVSPLDADTGDGGDAPVRSSVGAPALPRSDPLEELLEELLEPSAGCADESDSVGAPAGATAPARCTAAFTDAGDKGAGLVLVTEFETDRMPCRPSTSASIVATAQPPTSNPLRRTAPA
jgi:hypothetical protein